MGHMKALAIDASASQQRSWLWDVSDSPDIQQAAIAFLNALVR